ncbi:hypothetical protein QJS83_06505 [Bdellovibrio sp. 22V]|uniref:hypothetical protein n=1 Tax=Bdellovibrio TaxID=958 RepID=UPI00254321DD|nr:hypothetical protein [Bdellovibrio sp. 22V]WII73521.1 hypothetical protein QJS83_06505 [Bdellovibrio sp. 22V]
MTKILILILASLLMTTATLARTLPAEAQLPSLMLDQKDALFYEEGVIPAGSESSLCGPTTAVNWLQLESLQQTYDKTQLVDLIKEIGSVLRGKHIEINRGLIEPDLLAFLQLLYKKLNIKKEFVVKGRYHKDVPLSEEELWNDRVQILLLNYTEIRSMSEGPHGRGRPPGRNIPLPDDLIPQGPLVRGNHFVLKVYADREQGVLGLIDPETPGQYTLLKVGTSEGSVTTVRPYSRRDFPRFAFGIPLRWSILSIIEEK